jgi:iron complex transport system substrate-binding protein
VWKVKELGVVAVLVLALWTATVRASGEPGPVAPRRIASMTLAADEVLSELVPVERIVAVSAASDAPASSYVAGHYPPRVARFRRAELERLIALKPDLVVVSEYTDADFLVLLRQSRLSAHRMTGLRSLSGIRQAILDLGRVVGASAAAQNLVRQFDSRLADLARRLAHVPRPRVLYWSQPYTAGAETAISAMIECAGGRNVARELGYRGLAPIGAERVFAASPDVFLVSGDAPALRSHALLAQLPSVKNDRIVDVPYREIVTLSQHAAEACRVLAGRLHPGLDAGASR